MMTSRRITDEAKFDAWKKITTARFERIESLRMKWLVERLAGLGKWVEYWNINCNLNNQHCIDTLLSPFLLAIAYNMVFHGGY